MGKNLCIGVLAFVFLSPLSAESALEKKAKAACQKGEYGIAVEIYEEWVKSLEGEMQDKAKIQLAIAYDKNQEKEKAIATFLEVLEHPPHVSASVCEEKEKALFEAALEKMHGSKKEVVPIAKEILREYGPIVEKNPSYYHLNFIVALAYANLQQFGEFFPRFYCSFQKLPEHFLVDKTCGVLRVKLAERTGDREAKEKQFVLALQCLLKALDKNPKDSHLYSLVLGVAHNKMTQREVIIDTLTKMVGEKAPIARSDILPYVRLAVTLGDEQLGQKIVANAAVQYPFSRAVQTAQSYLAETSSRSNSDD